MHPYQNQCAHQRTGDTASMQGQPYIKTSLQDHSRERFLLNSERQEKVSKIKKHGNYFKSKEQKKCPERKNNETVLTSLLDLEFKEKIIKMLKELRNISIEMQITVTRNY